MSVGFCLWPDVCIVTRHATEKTTPAPNTTLRSRVLGKPLMARFPSPLPSDTVLDCILDQNWRENGILHVLDVIKWKGQDIADCESSFRSAVPFAVVRPARLDSVNTVSGGGIHGCLSCRPRPLPQRPRPRSSPKLQKRHPIPPMAFDFRTPQHFYSSRTSQTPLLRISLEISSHGLAHPTAPKYSFLPDLLMRT